MKHFILILSLSLGINSYSQKEELYLIYNKENRGSYYMYDSSERICDSNLEYLKYYISITSNDPKFKSDLYTFGSYEKPEIYSKNKNIQCITIKDLLKQSPSKNHEFFSIYKKIFFLIKNKDGNQYIIKVNYLGTVKDVIVTNLN